MNGPISIRLSDSQRAELEHSRQAWHEETLTQTVKRHLQASLDAEKRGIAGLRDGTPADVVSQFTREVKNASRAASSVSETVDRLKAETSWIRSGFKLTAYRVFAGFLVGLLAGLFAGIFASLAFAYSWF